MRSSFDAYTGYAHIGRQKMSSEEAVNYALEVMDAAAEGEYASALYAYAQEELGYTDRDARALAEGFIQWKNRRLTESLTGESK